MSIEMKLAFIIGPVALYAIVVVALQLRAVFLMTYKKEGRCSPTGSICHSKNKSCSLYVEKWAKK